LGKTLGPAVFDVAGISGFAADSGYEYLSAA